MNRDKSSGSKKKRFGKIDIGIVVITFVLVVFGLIMLYSASSYNSQIKFGSSSWFLRRQLFYSVGGFLLMMIISFIPYKMWRYGAIPIYLLGVVSVLLVMSGLGIESNGARRWLDIKIATVQPAEILKLGIILLLAAFLTRFMSFLDDWRIYVLGFFIYASGCALTLFVTDDLGTAIIIFAIGFIMMLVSCPKLKYLIITAAASLVAVAGVILLKENKRVRFDAWLNLDKYSDGIGYQITQALYAIGSGGLIGKGLGRSTQKMGFVPESQNDMIFSIVCEELGVIGGVFLLVLIGILIWRMKKIYDRTEDTFGRLVVAGVATHIAIQTFVNMAVVTNILPNTGVPLPFISYGGTAIIFLLAEIGIVLSIGRIREAEPRDLRQEYYDQLKQRDASYFQ